MYLAEQVVSLSQSTATQEGGGAALPVGLAGQQQAGGADTHKPPKKAHSWPLAAVQHQGPGAQCSTSRYLRELASGPLHLLSHWGPCLRTL